MPEEPKYPAVISNADSDVSSRIVPIIESYVFTEARRNLGVYGERLLLRIYESAQRYIHDLVDFSGGELNGEKIEIGEWGDAELVIPVRAILSSSTDRNYETARAAIVDLMGKFLSFDNGETFQTTQILNDAEVNRLQGRMVIRVNRNIWKAMLNFTRGYRLVDVETAMRLRSIYAVRLYSLVCRSKSPLTFTLKQLRDMWELNDKYPTTAEFIRNTVDKAKAELDEKSQYSFRYTTNSSKTDPENLGRRGKLKITSITFYPVRRYVFENQKKKNLAKSIAPSVLLGREVTDILKHKFGFVNQGISNNGIVFETAKKHFDLVEFLEKIAPAALRSKNPQGYVVGAVRNRLIEDVGIPEEEIQ